MRNKADGITLIALIITIIVMLILVAVSITLLTNSGIFGQASDAVLEQRAAHADEVAQLWRVEATHWPETAPDRDSVIWELYNNGTLTEEEREELLDWEEIRIGTRYPIHFNVGNSPLRPPHPPIEMPENETSVQFSNERGVLEIVWIDLNNNVIADPLTPATNTNWLAGMTPVRHDGSWVTTEANNANWYDYDARLWANARDNDQNMFVWIPRYAYRIAYFDTSANANARRANPAHMEGLLGFSTIHGMVEIDSVSGNSLVTGSTPRNVVGTVQTSGFNDHIPHPAFTFGNQVPGIWMGKYATGFIGTTPGNAIAPARVVIQEGRSFWHNISPSNIFDTSRGFANPATNGITGTSIMMRNRDWGAAAYLSHSRFGRNGEAVAINDSMQLISGHGGNAASTTGNATGIFDMRGGVREYVAAYVDNSTARGRVGLESIRNAAERYRDVYVIGSPETPNHNYLANRNVVGNAVFETSINANSDAWGAWFGASANFPSGTGPALWRSGRMSDGATAGVFHFSGWTRQCVCACWIPCYSSPINKKTCSILSIGYRFFSCLDKVPYRM